MSNGERSPPERIDFTPPSNFAPPKADKIPRSSPAGLSMKSARTTPNSRHICSARDRPTGQEPPEISEAPPKKIMKLKNPLALLFAWLGLALAPAQTVAAAESSPSSVSPTTLSGLVTNSATGRTLEGALVVI